MSSVLIESKIKRPGGTIVDFNEPTAPGGLIRYHFRDDGFGNHVAAVENEDHIARFLEVRDGFKLFASAAPSGLGIGALGGVALLSGEDSIANAIASTIQADLEPSQGSGDPIEGDQDEDDTEGGEGAGEVVDAEAAARAEYERVFGVPARNNMKVETILAKIDAHKAATAG